MNRKSLSWLRLQSGKGGMCLQVLRAEERGHRLNEGSLHERKSISGFDSVMDSASTDLGVAARGLRTTGRHLGVFAQF